MTKESRSRPSPMEETQRGGIPPDLIPLSELDQREHIRIINQLSNLLLWTIRALEEQRVPRIAKDVSDSASAILTDYDPDVADIITRAVSRPDTL